MTVREKAERLMAYWNKQEIEANRQNMTGDLEEFARTIRKEALEEVLKGIAREQRYHEWRDDKGEEMRHPVSACKEIAGYVRAMKNTDTIAAGATAKIE